MDFTKECIVVCRFLNVQGKKVDLKYNRPCETSDEELTKEAHVNAGDMQMKKLYDVIELIGIAVVRNQEQYDEILGNEK